MNLAYPGLDVSLEKDMLRINGRDYSAAVRTVGDMAPVLAKPSVLPPKTPAYWMFRACSPEKDKNLLEKKGLRFDVTDLAHLDFGGEPNKTYGPYHPPAPSGVPYSELYEVMHGEAYYLLQKRKKGSDAVERVLLVRTKKGQKAIMPPGYGHVTINPEGLLVMDNLVEGTFASDYAPYRSLGGAAYFWTHDGLQKNKKYGKLPSIEEMGAPELNARVDEALAKDLEKDASYRLFLEKPDLFDFLKAPEKLPPSRIL